MSVESTPPPPRRRGRPQRLPEDPHTLASGVVGCDQRVAWMLGAARTLGPDPELARRDGFIARLKADGIPVDASRVSRWESGLQPLPGRVMATYEDVLGLTEGSLVAVAAGLRRSFGTGPTPRENGVRDRDLTDQELSRLIDIADSGAATGAQWLELADHFSRFDRVFLRESDWTSLCRRLVTELGSAVGPGYVRRYEAAAAFIRQQNARRHLILAVGQFVTDPDAQVVAPVLNLLSEVPDPAAAALTLRMLSADSDNKYLRRAASSVAAVKLARGHFDDSALPRLESHVVGALRRGESLDGRLDSFDLAVRLPDESWDRVHGALRTRRAHALVDLARAGDEMIPAARAASVVADLAPAVQADTHSHLPQEPDMMLRRLLREALFHSHKPRRHHAALLIAATPYAHATARHCLRLAADPNDLIAARAWTVLMRVGDGGQRPDVLRHACEDKRPSVRARALVNVGLGGALEPDEASRLAGQYGESRTLERHATLFALGMAGAPQLAALAESEDSDTRRGARWWLAQGPAIHDGDVTR
jgi:HEAT repeat protein